MDDVSVFHQQLLEDLSRVGRKVEEILLYNYDRFRYDEDDILHAFFLIFDYKYAILFIFLDDGEVEF